MRFSVCNNVDMIHNPVIKGFNPDPSITFDGNHYVLAVSTFEYMPGITLYTSKDLRKWEYAASALDGHNGFSLENTKNSMGIYAPTIRYHKGRYYIVTTEKNGRGNFIIHADNIHGPWSEPSYLTESGIDPSIFFDEDGKCFYVQNGKGGIFGAYINPDDGCLLSPLSLICEGITGAATEGPHIYKREGLYYLLFAEGGTKYAHRENAARSVSITGPYEVLKTPILCHRERTRHTVQATGHADMIELDDGRWIAVFLAIRKSGLPLLHTLGRETFMAEVTWVDKWPIIGRCGYVELEEPGWIETIPDEPVFVRQGSDIYNYPVLTPRGMATAFSEITEDGIKLKGNGSLSDSSGVPSLILLRQKDFKSYFKATLDVSSLKGKAGIAVYYNSDYYAAMYIEKNISGKLTLNLRRHIHDFEGFAFSEDLHGTDSILLEIYSDESWYRFLANGKEIGKASTASFATEGTMYVTYTGTMIGIFAEEGEARFIGGFGFAD